MNYKEEWQIKMMAVYFYVAHGKGFTFHAQPQTGAYSCFQNMAEILYNETYLRGVKRRGLFCIIAGGPLAQAPCPGELKFKPGHWSREREVREEA